MDEGQGQAQMALPAEVVTQNFRELQYELRLQSLAKQVQPFNGESSRSLRNWMRDMTKIGLTVGSDDEKMKILSLQTLKGGAAEYYSRLLRTNPQITWTEIVNALRARFSDQADQQLAAQKLKRVKQKSGESVQSFAERIIDLAEEAFATVILTPPLIQQQLKDIFLEGVRNDAVARKIIRLRPVMLDAALQVAIEEELTAKTFQLRRNDEPMEVDNVQAEVTPGQSLQQSVTELMAAVAEIKAEKVTGKNRPRKTPTYNGKTMKWTSDGKIICAHCDKIGHRYMQCRKRKAELEAQALGAQKSAQGNWKTLAQPRK